MSFEWPEKTERKENLVSHFTTLENASMKNIRQEIYKWLSKNHGAVTSSMHELWLLPENEEGTT